MYQLILIVHIFAAVCLIALVLVQQGRGAAMGAAFGSGASQTVFGSRGSGSFLLRVTIGFVVVFFSTSMGLNYMASQAIKQEKPLVLPVLPANKIPEPAAPVTPNSIPTVTPNAVPDIKPIEETRVPNQASVIQPIETQHNSVTTKKHNK